MTRPRWIVHWSIQDTKVIPPWPVCAGHRESVKKPLGNQRPVLDDGTIVQLVETKVTDGICSLAAFGNCCEDPVTNIPDLDVTRLDV